jgi:hypothetical protein
VIVQTRALYHTIHWCLSDKYQLEHSIGEYTGVLITVPIKPCPGTKQYTDVLVIVQTRALYQTIHWCLSDKYQLEPCIRQYKGVLDINTNYRALYQKVHWCLNYGTN